MTEMDKLEKWLKENAPRFGWTYTREDKGTLPYDQHQICVYSDGIIQWDVICHYGSYGYRQGLLEIYGNLVDGGVKGWLTAEDIIRRIEKKEWNE